jgi:hypothetical protein
MNLRYESVIRLANREPEEGGPVVVASTTVIHPGGYDYNVACRMSEMGQPPFRENYFARMGKEHYLRGRVVGDFRERKVKITFF